MKRVLITCDTEVGELSRHENDAFDIFVEGKVDSKEVGVALINQIAKEYKAYVLHFVDVYAYKNHGEKEFSDLCQNILKGGHFLGLHTHPSSLYDPNRSWMHQYSFEEQCDIIAFGLNKMKEWTGEAPLTHRAGNYGINQNTLNALKENGINYDYSYYKGHPNCFFQHKNLNNVFKENDIMMVPVTIFEDNKCFLPSFKKVSSYKKLDFRYSNLKQVIQCINLMSQNSTVILFLHSFNFLNIPYDAKRKKFGQFTINHQLIKDYRTLLRYVSDDPNFHFVKPDEITCLGDEKEKCLSFNSYSSDFPRVIKKLNRTDLL